MSLPCRFQLNQAVAVLSAKPMRDFTGPVVGIHFATDGIVLYDVRDTGGNIVHSIDSLDVREIDHTRHQRHTRAQREITA